MGHGRNNLPLPPQEVGTWDDSPDVFVVDTKGDPKNLQYGTIHRHDVPTFYRQGSGSVVGLPQRYKIDRNPDDGPNISITDRSELPAGSREKYAFARGERKGIKRLRIKPAEDEHLSEAPRSFIRLSTNGKASRDQAGSGKPPPDEDDSHYRSIEGKAKASNAPGDSDLEFASDSSKSEYERINIDALSESARHRNIKLSRKTEEDPGNIDSWIALIEHQDVLIQSRSRDPTNAEKRSTAEVKLSMYEEALRSARSSNGDNPRLLIGYMREGAKFWDSTKLSSKWTSVLEKSTFGGIMWIEYLSSLQTEFVSYKYESVRDKCLECVAILRKKLPWPHEGIPGEKSHWRGSSCGTDSPTKRISTLCAIRKPSCMSCFAAL